MSKSKVDPIFDDFRKEIYELFEAENEKIQALQQQVDALKASPDEFATPKYGLLPVAPVVYEKITELAQRRGISPGVLMLKEEATRHLLMLIERDIL